MVTRRSCPLDSRRLPDGPGGPCVLAAITPPQQPPLCLWSSTVTPTPCLPLVWLHGTYERDGASAVGTDDSHAHCRTPSGQEHVPESTRTSFQFEVIKWEVGQEPQDLSGSLLAQACPGAGTDLQRRLPAHRGSRSRKCPSLPAGCW